ncbi:hypothetical protein HAX54_042965 [Datura stramonium]|uniref:Non-haem dioxygenase N-terminal domain-containing protein n=1 Tax=Datura stramonium TaxID=4076 RepID=A0ABS8SMS2_DATST|nr:hypothetical protein [Datura stramonium]
MSALNTNLRTPPVYAGAAVPVIDLRKLTLGDSMDSELQKLHSACQQWSFLQNFKREVIEFFGLPMEEKKKLWQQEDNHEGFGQLFVVSEEQKLDWSDMFYITTLPPHNPANGLVSKIAFKAQGNHGIIL